MANPNNRVFRREAYIQEPLVGDIVQLASISTRDVWHPHRHKLLWQKYIVLSIKAAEPETGYPYNGWYNLALKILEPSNAVRDLITGNKIRIETCQVKILERELKGTMAKQKTNEVDYAYSIRDNLRKRMEVFNFEMSKDIIPNDTNRRTIVRNNDKGHWELLRSQGYRVEWINYAHQRPRWKDATTIFPFKTKQSTIRFRVNIWDPKLELFNEQYKVEEIT